MSCFGRVGGRQAVLFGGTSANDKNIHFHGCIYLYIRHILGYEHIFRVMSQLKRTNEWFPWPHFSRKTRKPFQLCYAKWCVLFWLSLCASCVLSWCMEFYLESERSVTVDNALEKCWQFAFVRFISQYEFYAISTRVSFRATFWRVSRCFMHVRRRQYTMQTATTLFGALFLACFTSVVGVFLVFMPC